MLLFEHFIELELKIKNTFSFTAQKRKKIISKHTHLSIRF